MNTSLLDKSVKVLLLTFLSFALLYYGRPFLVPFLLASLLAMLLLPLCSRLERIINKVAAVSISLFLLLSIISLLIYIIGLQISDVSDNASQIEKNVTIKLGQLREFLTNTLGISAQRQQEILQEQQPSTGKISNMITGFAASFGGFLTDFIIVTVYIFLFLLFRSQFQKFILMLVPRSEKEAAQTIMHDVRKVAQKYLTGLAIMIACLWVMYGVGFYVIGVKNPVFFAILCGMVRPV